MLQTTLETVFPCLIQFSSRSFPFHSTRAYVQVIRMRNGLYPFDHFLFVWICVFFLLVQILFTLQLHEFKSVKLKIIYVKPIYTDFLNFDLQISTLMAANLQFNLSHFLLYASKMIGKHACLLYRLMFNIADETHITNVLYCVS